MNSDKPAGPITSAPASVSRLEILKKRSWLERAKRYFTGADLDDAEAAGLRTITRVQDDLPPQVRAVAIAQLITNGFSAFCGFAVATGFGLLSIIGPIFFGRTGVGYGMIGLTGAGLSSVISVLPLLVARAAARILRRDPRGVKPVLRWAWIFAVGSGIALVAVSAQFTLAIAENGTMGRLSMIRGIISLLSSVAFQSWSVITLRRYKHEVAAEIVASENETVNEIRRDYIAFPLRAATGDDKPGE